MEKLPEIATIVKALTETYGEESVQVSNNWDSETDSVGVVSAHNNDLLAYICWYPQGYFVSLELPAPYGDPRPYIAEGEYADLSMEQTIEIVGKHLNLLAT